MKKSLYMTTALAAAGVVALGVSGAMAASKAKPIKITTGGAFKSLVGFGHQSGSFEGNATTGQTGYDDFNQVNDAEIHFKGSTKLDNGLSVSVMVQLEADQSNGTDIDESLMTIAGGFGTLRLGSSKSVVFLMGQGGPTAGAMASYGHPDTNNWVIRPAASALDNGKINTNGGGGDNMKITYMSPSFSGFSVGGTYEPSGTNNDTMPAVGGNAGTDTQTYMTDVRWMGKISSASIGADLGYWETHGDAASSSKTHRMGLKVGFGAFSVGTSRKETKDLDAAIDANGHEAYEAGLVWTSGPVKLSANYFNVSSEQTAAIAGEDEVTKYGVGGVYNMGPGVDLVGSILHVNWEDEVEATKASNNSGWAAVGGISLKF
jgi:outer membrane protein OmpU